MSNNLFKTEENRLIFFAGEETPRKVETAKDVPDRTDTETYEQKLERFQTARKAIEQEIKDTQDPELKQKLQKEYDAFLKEGSQMFKDLQELEVSREKIIESSLRRLARFSERTGLGNKMKEVAEGVAIFQGTSETNVEHAQAIIKLDKTPDKNEARQALESVKRYRKEAQDFADENKGMITGKLDQDMKESLGRYDQAVKILDEFVNPEKKK